MIAWLAALALAASSAMLAMPAQAQGMQSVDPNAAIDADLQSGAAIPPPPRLDDRYTELPPAPPTQAQVPSGGGQGATATRYTGAELEPQTAAQPAPVNAAAQASANNTTYGEDDLIGAAEGVFGKGAEGLARLIEGILRDQGEPNAYIVGREGGGAFILGVRYGSGTLFHRVEGERPVYWTGPSVGFDAGANAANTFVLVYNLYDTEELFTRFPAGEGQAYILGGFHASYLRRGDKVLIPIRVGAGLRLGVNAGYMRFSKRQRWVPF